MSRSFVLILFVLLIFSPHAYADDLDLAYQVGTAVEHSDHAKVKKLLTQFQDWNSLNYSTDILGMAITKNETRMIQVIINAGFNLSQQNIRQNTVEHLGTSMHSAAAHGASEKIIRILIDAGAQVNALDSRGSTPLRIAENCQHKETIGISILEQMGR